LSLQVPEPYATMLEAITKADLRSRPQTVLRLIEEEYRRRHPAGTTTESGSTSMQVDLG